MPEMTDNEAARRRAIRTIGDYLPWRKDWRPADIDTYHRGLEDLTPDQITAAITDAIRERRTIPSVSQLRDYHLARIHENERARQAHDDQERRAQRDRGQGCPHCRREYQIGEHAEWIDTPFEGETTIGMTTCTEHRVSWRNTFPPERDPGELPGEVVAQLARQGTLGTIFQQVVKAKDQAARETGATEPVTITPADVTRALTGEPAA